jgi:tetratricopeptide (TPR) repeat protein
MMLVLGSGLHLRVVRLLGAAGLILSALFPSSLVSAAELADINRADQLLAAGRHAEAEREYDRILTEGVDEFLIGTVLTDGVHISRGYARVAQRKFDPALEDAEWAIKPQSSLMNSDGGYGLRAFIKLQRGDREGAFADYQLALDAAGKGMASGMRTGVAHAARAYGSLLVGDYAAAKADFAKATSVDGTSMGVDFLRGYRPFWAAIAEEVLPALASGDNARARARIDDIVRRLGLREKAGLEVQGIDSGADSGAAKAILLYEMNGPLLVLNQRLDTQVAGEHAQRSAAAMADAQKALLAGNRKLAFERFVQAYREAPDTQGRSQAIQGLAMVMRGMLQRPEISEDVRRLLVRAQVLAEEKDYAGAVDAYWKALDLVPWYAQLHYDRAILIAQLAASAPSGQYDVAIEEMNRYLVLAPDAKEARSAKDLIYQWEIKRERAAQRSQSQDLPVHARGGSATAAGNPDCFIATAAYGSYLDPHVSSLRNFRDRYLLPNAGGRWFVERYYQYSPPIADAIRERDALRALTRFLLVPIVFSVEYPLGALVVLLLLGAALFAWRSRSLRDKGQFA